LQQANPADEKTFREGATMTVKSHYKSNLRDIFFNLFEVLDVQKETLGKGPFRNFDEATAKEALKNFEQVCHEKIATSFEEGDRVPLRIDAQGNVYLPEGLKKSLQSYFDGDWHRMNLPERLGGFGAAASVFWSAYEMLVGANAAVGLYVFGPYCAQVIDWFGTDSQKARFISNIIEKQWGTTMVLTEADAGSDVGAGRAKAKHLHDDVWEISGVKRFITDGDFDLPENIMHMVLARPEGAEAGTKGLSLFIVPKFWVDENGKMGERNGVYCTNIEKKMGIKGSSTCEMTFGERGPARGILLGDKHDGIKQMFKVIEHARMAVGVKSMATLSTAYLNALEFTKDRVQGPDLMRAMEKASPRVRIIAHPDVRRMLMLQKSHAEGMRALCTYCAHVQDLVKVAEDKGDQALAKELHLVAEFLQPLVKGYNSEKAYDLLAVSLQCFGGSGYTQDYPIEQYIRDQKIDSLYEGTTHIQSLDLIFRKIAKNGGQTLMKIVGDIQSTLEKKKAGALLEIEYDALSRALADAQGIMGTMMGKMGESYYHVGLHGNRILLSIAELVIGWLLVRQAEVAIANREKASAEDRAFYEGKLASARFYCQNTLPGLTLSRKIIEKSGLDLMELREEAF